MSTELVVVLINPSRPENVGFVCRAMKTQGFPELRIVGEEWDLFDTNARKTAYGSHDVLKNVKWFSDFRGCTKDIDFVIGTSARERVTRKDRVSAKALPELIEEKGDSIQKMGIVFGDEENGMSTKDLSRCDVVSYIPLVAEYPSLNLAQAVLIYLYEFSTAGKESSQEETDQIPVEPIYKNLRKKTEKLLDELDIGTTPVLRQRILDRLGMINDTDARLLLSLMKKLHNRKK